MKKGFTLAEVLITLGIIGVVAAITMPTIITSVTERANSEREANIAYKVTQAMEHMRALGLLNSTYSSTESFTDELVKHLKVAKRCDSSHIAECWPTNKVTDGEGKEFDVSKAKTGKNLSLASNTNNVGLVLADGGAIILNYNPDTKGLDVGDPVKAYNKSLPTGLGTSKSFAYSTNVTSSIDFVMDVNGGKGPNSETVNNKFHDIRSFKGARFSKGCAGFEVDGVGCVVVLGTNYEPDGVIEEVVESHGGTNVYTYPNYYAGAVKACQNIDMSLADSSIHMTLFHKRDEYPELNVISHTTQMMGSDAPSHYHSNNGFVICIGN